LGDSAISNVRLLRLAVGSALWLAGVALLIAHALVWLTL
jgi:hypothetical protein